MKLDITEEQGISREESRKAIEHFKKTKTPVTCGGSGCYACCSLPVGCYPQEVEKIADLVVSGQVEIDLEMLERQVQGSKDNKDKYCPFLKDGGCSIYDNRPVQCSRMLVVSDPKNCITGSKKPDQVKPEKADKRWDVLTKIYGRVNLRLALFGHLKREGLYD